MQGPGHNALREATSKITAFAVDSRYHCCAIVAPTGSLTSARIACIGSERLRDGQKVFEKCIFEARRRAWRSPLKRNSTKGRRKPSNWVENRQACPASDKGHSKNISNYRRLNGRGGRARTYDNRFWRPVLYQLSYTPKEPRHRTCPAACSGRLKHIARLICKRRCE